MQYEECVGRVVEKNNFFPSLLSPLVKVYHSPHENLNAVLTTYSLWRNLL